MSPPWPAYCTQQTGGLTRGMTLRAVQTAWQPRASDSLPDRRRTAVSAPTQDIACKTLPCVFARKGLLPRHGGLFRSMDRNDTEAVPGDHLDRCRNVINHHKGDPVGTVDHEGRLAIMHA
jgi:hypothetical protein